LSRKEKANSQAQKRKTMNKKEIIEQLAKSAERAKEIRDTLLASEWQHALMHGQYMAYQNAICWLTCLAD
jgi:hypothetical protein